jgi:hypothetical protein
MQRCLALLIVIFPFSILSAQQKKQYSLEDREGLNKVCFYYSSSFGNCRIMPAQDDNPVNIYGYISDQVVEPVFFTKEDGAVEHVYLDLMNQSNSLARSVGLSFFSSPSDADNDWHVYFSRQEIFNLNLVYGIGTAEIDLSDLAVSQVKVKSGSADVKIGYHRGFPNKVEMDTFQVEVDMGNVTIDKLNSARTKYFLADVGFGNLEIDLSEKLNHRTTVFASVGAGNFIVTLPDDHVIPMKIILKSTPLCRLKLPKGYQEIENNVFVSDTYQSEAEELIVFNLDVGMGSISFHKK